jgi:hypothetical protein
MELRDKWVPRPDHDLLAQIARLEAENARLRDVLYTIGSKTGSLSAAQHMAQRALNPEEARHDR